MDRLEGHPNWYRRAPVEVDMVDMEGNGIGERISAELYFLDDAFLAGLGTDLVQIDSGDFRDQCSP